MKKIVILILCCGLLGSYVVASPKKRDAVSPINTLLNSINPQNMWTNLNHLTNYHDRSAYHATGKEAELWIKEQLEHMIAASGRNDVSLFTVATKGKDKDGDYHHFAQSSLVLKIGNSREPGVVIGAHFDTVSCEVLGRNCAGSFPGADDDGSGTVAVLETARTLIHSGMTFKKPIYLILYAAEEEGMLGSQLVVQYFKQHQLSVEAVMQLDMIGYMHRNDPTIWLDASHTTPELNNYCVNLVKNYIKKPARIIYGDDSGESDHLSWYQAGYKTVFPFESSCYHERGCPGVEHTNRDTIERNSLVHMTDYLKLALAFAADRAVPEV